MSFIPNFIKNNFNKALLIAAGALAAPALANEAIKSPYYFGAQILMIGATLAGNYYFTRNAAQRDFQILNNQPLVNQAPAIPANQRQRLFDMPTIARTSLYPDMSIDFVPSETSMAQIGADRQEITLESGGVFDECQLFLAVLRMNKEIDAHTGEPILINPQTSRAMTMNDIYELCDRFGITDFRQFLNIWDTAASCVEDLPQDQNRNQIESDFRIDNAIQLISKMNIYPEKVDKLQDLR